MKLINPIRIEIILATQIVSSVYDTRLHRSILSGSMLQDQYHRHISFPRHGVHFMHSSFCL